MAKQESKTKQRNRATINSSDEGEGDDTLGEYPTR